ncbi:MAG: hypothetical protein J2P50_17805, partial [Hyphomicrobiaceae bacterium]|nr:hypothetical protein [Hyphomicrobiaceae bacterium]
MSEERIVPSAVEFESTASRATVVAANVLQALLVLVVALWVLDAPRRLFNAAFYTEQLLAVCLGLSLALAFVSEQPARSRFDWAGAAASAGLAAYIAFLALRSGDVPPALYAALAVCVLWALFGSRAPVARWLDWAAAALSLLICGWIAAFYETLTAEIALIPPQGLIGSAVLILLVLEASRRISGLGFVSIIAVMALYIFVSPHFSGTFQTRSVSPERLVVYLGVDANGIISSILQVAVLVVIPFTILGQVLART